MKPKRSKSRKGRENQQNEQLRDQKWRLLLCRSRRFQRRNLGKRLDDQDEDVEVESRRRADYVDGQSRRLVIFPTLPG